jgi:hypothetical protein
MRIVVLLLVAGFLGDVALASPECSDHLSIGSSRIITVRARNPWNCTGLTVRSGEVYNFQVDKHCLWVDFYWPTSADGYRFDPLFPIQFLFKKDCVLPATDWFVLCAAVNCPCCGTVPIGSCGTMRIMKSGYLGLFANDTSYAYWNNWGQLKVRITRAH